MKIEKSELKGLKYLIRYPKGYKEGDKCPVIIFLHGAGSRGENIEPLASNPYFKITEKHETFPFITVAPLCSENTWYDVFERLRELARYVSTASFADPDRIYLMGASMGGYGTWQLAMSCPELFAAIVPICGGGAYWNAERLKELPVWAFHGRKDPIVMPEESEKMVNAVIANGGNARLTVYLEAAHNAWTDTYSNYAVFEWMLSCSKNKANICPEKYTNRYSGSEIYG